MKFPASFRGFPLAIVLTLAVVYWLYFSRLFVVQDVNPEAMDQPLTVAYLEQGRIQGISTHEFFTKDSLFENLKREDPDGANAYYGHRFQFEFFALLPFTNLLYLPFVKLAGVSFKTVSIYSAFFCGLSFLGTGILAFRMFGRWNAVLSVLLLSSSLSWLIHVKVGYASWMPSVVLMIGLAFCLFSYLEEKKLRVTNPQNFKNDFNLSLLITIGFLLGLMYLVVWVGISFGILMACLAVFVARGPRSSLVLLDLGIMVAGFMLMLGVVTMIYCLYWHCAPLDVHAAIYDVLFGRFSQGTVPAHPLSLAGKIVYMFRCFFFDMHPLDHMDKCLEGRPAISWFFSLSFFIGLFYCFKKRRTGDKILLVWMAVIFGVFATFFMFSHRYSLLVLPAMSIVAARGILGLASDLALWRGRLGLLPFQVIVGLGLGSSLLQVHHDFYTEYLLHKPPDFEVDRLRGHFPFANWLKKNFPPENTLVVLGDPIMFPRTSFLFNTFGKGYSFIYWSNHFGTGSAPQQIRDWENQAFQKYRTIIFAFSPVLLGDPKTHVLKNDWRPFVATHPGIQPVFTYSYSGRPPSIFSFAISKKHGK